MVTVQILGVPLSTCTKRVMTTCNELGINYEIKTVDIRKGEHKDPDYVANKHPFAIIPVLIDEDGTQLFESRAICRYLTAKYGKGTGLMPPSSDVKAYGIFEQAASIEYSSFDPAAFGLTFERVFTKAFIGRDGNEEFAQRHIKTLEAKMEGYERILSKQKYLAGDHITLADLFHLPYGAFVERISPEILTANPHVKQWWEDISSRPSWTSIKDL